MIIDDIERHINNNNMIEIEKIFEKTDFNIPLSHNRTPLIHSVLQHKYNFVYYFLRQEKIDIDLKDDEGMTPLMHAAKNGFISILKLLIYYNANPHLKNDYDVTALIIARKNGNKLCEDMLELPIKVANKVKERNEKRKRLGRIDTPPPILLLTYIPQRPSNNDSQLIKIYKIIKNFIGK